MGAVVYSHSITIPLFCNQAVATHIASKQCNIEQQIHRLQVASARSHWVQCPTKRYTLHFSGLGVKYPTPRLHNYPLAL